MSSVLITPHLTASKLSRVTNLPGSGLHKLHITKATVKSSVLTFDTFHNPVKTQVQSLATRNTFSASFIRTALPYKCVSSSGTFDYSWQNHTRALTTVNSRKSISSSFSKTVHYSHVLSCDALKNPYYPLLSTRSKATVKNKMSVRENLIEYQPPPWLDGKLSSQPKYRVQLANLPTPIHSWSLPEVPAEFSVDIKRDDCTEGPLGGNKVRKLEFLIADVIDKGCVHVSTCGGIQSNHCRATALAAARFGLTPHLFLRADIQKPSEVGCQGNLLLNRLSGAKMYFVPRKSQYEPDIKPRMEKLATKIEEETGEKLYNICIGGSDSVGVYGYLHAFEELIQQGVFENYDDVVFSCGSGGTAEGLALANYLTGSRLKIHAIIVSDGKEYFQNHVNKTIANFGLDGVTSDDILDIIDGYKGEGYGISTPQELDFLTKVSLQTGIILDPVYTGKAVYGMVKEMRRCPGRFQGRRVLFIHTGGVFGLFDERINEKLTQHGALTNQIAMWPSQEDEPPAF